MHIHRKKLSVCFFESTRAHVTASFQTSPDKDKSAVESSWHITDQYNYNRCLASHIPKLSFISTNLNEEHEPSSMLFHPTLRAPSRRCSGVRMSILSFSNAKRRNAKLRRLK